MGTESHHVSPVPFGFQERLKALMMPDIHFVPVIQTGPLEVSVIHLKPERMYQMQGNPGGPAEPSDVPGICRDLRVQEDHVKTGVIDRLMGHVLPLGPERGCFSR